MVSKGTKTNYFQNAFLTILEYFIDSEVVILNTQIYNCR